MTLAILIILVPAVALAVWHATSESTLDGTYDLRRRKL